MIWLTGLYVTLSTKERDKKRNIFIIYICDKKISKDKRSKSNCCYFEKSEEEQTKKKKKKDTKNIYII